MPKKVKISLNQSLNMDGDVSKQKQKRLQDHLLKWKRKLAKKHERKVKGTSIVKAIVESFAICNCRDLNDSVLSIDHGVGVFKTRSDSIRPIVFKPEPSLNEVNPSITGYGKKKMLSQPHRFERNGTSLNLFAKGSDHVAYSTIDYYGGSLLQSPYFKRIGNVSNVTDNNNKNSDDIDGAHGIDATFHYSSAGNSVISNKNAVYPVSLRTRHHEGALGHDIVQQQQNRMDNLLSPPPLAKFPPPPFLSVSRTPRPPEQEEEYKPVSTTLPYATFQVVETSPRQLMDQKSTVEGGSDDESNNNKNNFMWKGMVVTKPIEEKDHHKQCLQLQIQSNMSIRSSVIPSHGNSNKEISNNLMEITTSKTTSVAADKTSHKDIKLVSTSTQTPSSANNCHSCGTLMTLTCMKCGNYTVTSPSNSEIPSTVTAIATQKNVPKCERNYDHDDSNFNDVANKEIDVELDSLCVDHDEGGSICSGTSLDSIEIIHTPRNKGELLLQAIQRTPKAAAIAHAESNAVVTSSEPRSLGTSGSKHRQKRGQQNNINTVTNKNNCNSDNNYNTNNYNNNNDNSNEKENNKLNISNNNNTDNAICNNNIPIKASNSLITMDLQEVCKEQINQANHLMSEQQKPSPENINKSENDPQLSSTGKTGAALIRKQEEDTENTVATDSGPRNNVAELGELQEVRDVDNNNQPSRGMMGGVAKRNDDEVLDEECFDSYTVITVRAKPCFKIIPATTSTSSRAMPPPVIVSNIGNVQQQQPVKHKQAQKIKTSFKLRKIGCNFLYHNSTRSQNGNGIKKSIDQKQNEISNLMKKNTVTGNKIINNNNHDKKSNSKDCVDEGGTSAMLMNDKVNHETTTENIKNSHEVNMVKEGKKGQDVKNKPKPIGTLSSPITSPRPSTSTSSSIVQKSGCPLISSKFPRSYNVFTICKNNLLGNSSVTSDSLNRGNASILPTAQTSNDSSCTDMLFVRKPLIGNFEESLLQRRLVPNVTGTGFRILVGTPNSVCPIQLSLPTEAYFYEFNGNTITTPYMCEARLPRNGFTLPRCGSVQVTLVNPRGALIRMFVIQYDMNDMPPLHQTFIRQRLLIANSPGNNGGSGDCNKSPLPPLYNNKLSTRVVVSAAKVTAIIQNFNKHTDGARGDCFFNDVKNMKMHIKRQQQQQQRSLNRQGGSKLGHFLSQKDLKRLRYSIHLRFQTSCSGRLMLHTDIRILILKRTNYPTRSKNVSSNSGLVIDTLMPTNPKYSLRIQEQKHPTTVNKSQEQESLNMDEID